MITAIASNNVAYLKKLPGIGGKAAAQIILDLKGVLTGGEKGNPEVYEDVYDALKEMGFKGAAIDRVLATINEPEAKPEDILRLALSKLNELKKK
jgi:Holliday junction DNA helicase RuvA